jgi:hypothetical protein
MTTTRNEIVLYQPNENVKLDVRIENETVWLTQAQIAELFGVKVRAISKHLNNIFVAGELDENSTCSILEYTEDSLSSPQEKIFLRCLEIAGCFTSNNFAICI